MCMLSTSAHMVKMLVKSLHPCLDYGQYVFLDIMTAILDFKRKMHIKHNFQVFVVFLHT